MCYKGFQLLIVEMGYVETIMFHQYDPKVLFDPLYNNASADT